jgi:class 3 adenylate cyclase/predicted ATPase
MDIGGWLRNLGLGQYEAAFRANEIDAKVLPDLTAGDLKELGVSAIGHRRAILAAIARLSAPSAILAEVEKPPLATPSVRDAAERRQLTVMFCDLVGSTALSARLDPEDMREIIGAYHRCCAEQITKAGGFVAKYMGDGVLAYFGYPHAHEDDAERGVRAALALIEAVPTIRAGPDAKLQVRIGISTGLVVVGDLIGEGAAQEQGVVGETPNLAARLQALAEPGQVAISQSTRRLAGGMFEYRDLGRVALKGLAEPVQAWQVTGSSDVQSRFEAQHGAALTPLVGRDEELDLLMRRWRQAASGAGRVVLLSGEPGIGKSRLTVALSDRLQDEPHTRVRYFCSPHHTDSAFYPVVAQLERAASFERHDTSEAKLSKLASLLGQPASHDNDIQLLTELLSIPTGDRFAPLNASAQWKKEKIFEALLRQLGMLTRQGPVFVVYEDIHWIDPSSRELLDMTVERVASLPVLLIITFRPEFPPPWIGQAHVTTLSLGRLDRRVGGALVACVAGNNRLPDEIVAQIVERTDGVPLFVEELTKAVLEGSDRGNRVTGRLAASPIMTVNSPATLHASLMARLDRLGAIAKKIAQIGAVLGREFRYELIEKMEQRPAAELQAGLDRLVEAGLLYCRGAAPQSSYLFKHALIQETAYETLLKSTRQQLHARVAEVCEISFPDTARTRPELVARHFAQAGLVERSIDYWQRAGELAMACTGYREAISHLSTALDFLAELPDTPERARKDLDICVKVIPLIITLTGASPEAGRIAARALSAARRLEEGPQHFMALWANYYYVMRSGRFREAAELAEEVLALANRLGDRGLLLEAYHARWGAALYGGQASLARTDASQGIALYEAGRHHPHVLAFTGHDSGVCARAVSSLTLWLTGASERAVRMANDAVALARQLSHPNSLATALYHVAVTHQCCGDVVGCGDLADRAVEVSREQGFSSPLAVGTFLSGWAHATRGDIETGICRMENGLAALETGPRIYVSYGLAVLAEIKGRVGRIAEGLELVRKGLALTEASGEGLFEPELHRLEGEFILGLSPSETAIAESCFRNAISIAKRQSALSLELRASTSLARLWRDQGKRTDARDLLAPIYGWFTEGFDTPDLKEAKALLEELS